MLQTRAERTELPQLAATASRRAYSGRRQAALQRHICKAMAAWAAGLAGMQLELHAPGLEAPGLQGAVGGCRPQQVVLQVQGQPVHSALPRHQALGLPLSWAGPADQLRGSTIALGVGAASMHACFGSRCDPYQPGGCHEVCMLTWLQRGCSPEHSTALCTGIMGTALERLQGDHTSMHHYQPAQV